MSVVQQQQQHGWEEEIGITSLVSKVRKNVKNKFETFLTLSASKG